MADAFVDEATTLEIRLPSEFDFAWTLGFLTARAVPSIERVGPDGYRRAVRMPDGSVADLAISHRPGILTVRAFGLEPGAAHRLVARMFDLNAPLDEFRRLADPDPLLGPLVRARPAIRLPQLADPFECLVRAILGQQVSVAAATTLTDRLVRRAGEAGPAAPGAAPHAFPQASAVAALGAEGLRTLGLTRTRAATLHSAAQAVATGGLDLEALRDASAEDGERALCALPGIGPWTAAYVRMRSLGARDSFPATDLGVIRALAARGVLRGDIPRVADRWRPWRAYATLHLWYADHGPGG